VVLKNLEVFSILSSRSDLRLDQHDSAGYGRGRVYGAVPVASHSPLFPKCFINAPNLTSLEGASVSGYVVKYARS